MLSSKDFLTNAKQLVGLPYKWCGDFSGEEDRVTPANVAAWHKADAYHFSNAKCDTLIRKFLGMLAGDCSGLVTHSIGIGKTDSASLWGLCVEKYKINGVLSIPSIEGMILYRLGHIGICTGDGHVVESGSTEYGVTITPFAAPQTMKAWTHYGYLRQYVDYPVPAPICPYSRPTVTYKSGKTFIGNDAGWYQWNLNQYHCANLKVDKIAGPQTWAGINAVQLKALGGTGAAGSLTVAAVEKP